jgi:predicted porin
LNLNFSLGWRYVETERTSKTSDPETGEMITVSNKGSGSGGTFSLSLQKNFSHTSMRFKADQNVGTNPNTGGTYERRRFSISVSHELTHSLKGDISLSYHDRETDRDDEFGGSEIDRETYYVSPRISYKYNNWLTIAMSYRYSKDKDNRRNREYDRNTFYLQLNFTLLRPYIIR